MTEPIDPAIQDPAVDLAQVRMVATTLTNLPPADSRTKDEHIAQAMAQFRPSEARSTPRSSTRRTLVSLAAAFLLVGGTAGWLIHGSPKASPAVAAAENTVARGPKGAVVGAAPVAPSCASAVSDSTYVGPVSWRNSTVLEFTVGTPTTAFVLVSPGTCAIVATIPVPQS